MELALQVVGLKMTGKIEDAKDIAMRIVGNSAQDSQGDSNSTSTQMMNLACNALPDSRRLLLGRGDDFEFERVIMDSLVSLDMRDDGGEPTCLTRIISHPTKTGQTLLHLAASSGFSSLVEFLIQRDIDIDAQDINGYTALHFAVLYRSQCCARQIINAGADKSICNKMGYTALELAPDDFFDQPRSSRCVTPVEEESDEESHFGDAEDDSGDSLPIRSQPRAHLKRRTRNNDRSRRSSVYSSLGPKASDIEKTSKNQVDDDDTATVVSPECLPLPKSQVKNPDPIMNEKQDASFAEFFQRAWAQFQPPPHLMPQMPHMPQLPNMPAWVYPVFVPMQAWPQFRNERHAEAGVEGKVVDDEHSKDTKSPSASWEGLMAQMGAAVTGQGLSEKRIKKHRSTSELKPELEEKSISKSVVVPSPSSSRSLLRRSQQNEEKVSEEEVKSYTYRPKTKTLVKAAKKGEFHI